MTSPPYTVSNVAKQLRDRHPSERKTEERDKNSEIEKIKRQLFNLIDRVEQLKQK